MKTLGFASIVTGGLVALTSPALAQDPVYVGDDDETLIVTERAPVSVGISIGGGISGFTDETMRDTTNVGGNWTARLGIGILDSPIAFEASYIGSAQSIDALGLDDDAVLVGNGAQAAIRLNAMPDYEITPFFYGGIAWRHYELANADVNTSAILDSDDVGEVPLGAGIGGNIGGFTLDVRGEYRWAFDADMVPSLNFDGDQAEMHRWGVNLSLGYTM